MFICVKITASSRYEVANLTQNLDRQHPVIYSVHFVRHKDGLVATSPFILVEPAYGPATSHV